MNLDWTADRLEDLRDLQETFWCKTWGLFLLGLLAVLPVVHRFPAAGAAIALLFCALCLRVVYGYIEAGHEQRRIDERLMESGDPQAVGLLVQSLSSARGRHRKSVITALTEMLPCLTEADAHVFTKAQRDAMRMTLLQGESIDLSLAILEAYEQIGLRPERGLVRVLAEGVLTHTRDRRIQEAARACLPHLNARVEEAEANRILSPPGSGPDLFGHPAHGMSGALSMSTLLPLDQGGH
jgi:hypothetical protein